MDALFQTSTISGVIQLAVAPVFLLAGISGALNVMSIRLGRIVDRGRQLNREIKTADAEQMQKIIEETRRLRARARLTNWAITLCTVSALFICLVIVVLFIGALFELDIGVFISFLFVISILSLVGAFILFLREVRKSTAAFKFGEEWEIND